MGKNKILKRSQFYKFLAHSIPGGGVNSLVDIGMDRKIYFCPFTMAGLEEMHHYSTDPRLYQYFTFPPHESLSDTEQYLKKLLARIGTREMDRQAMYWFIRRVSDHKLLGSFGLTDINYEYRSCEWGYGIDPSEWGKGYILEVQEVAKDYVFNGLQLNRLHGKTRADNSPTLASVFSAGFEQEGTLRDFYCDHLGRYYDAVLYGLLAGEYQQQQNSKKAQRNETSRQTAGKLLDNQSANNIILSVLEVTDVNVADETEGLSMAEIPEWDSYHHIQVVAAIQEHTGVRLSPKEIAEATSAKKIVQFVNGRG